MRWLIFICLFPGPGWADAIVATRTIRANDIISITDVAIKRSGAQSQDLALADVVGKEARVAIYAGRPIQPDHLGMPAVIARNQLVLMTYHSNGLTITDEGRALSRGGVGERIRVMSLSSRSTLVGRVLETGEVSVEVK